MSTIAKETLYHLVDTPPESEFATAARVLEALRASSAESRYTAATAPP